MSRITTKDFSFKTFIHPLFPLGIFLLNTIKPLRIFSHLNQHFLVNGPGVCSLSLHFRSRSVLNTGAANANWRVWFGKGKAPASKC